MAVSRIEDGNHLRLCRDGAYLLGQPPGSPPGSHIWCRLCMIHALEPIQML